MGIDATGFKTPIAQMFERKKFWEAHRVMREREYYHLEHSATFAEIAPPFHSLNVRVLPCSRPRGSRGTACDLAH